MKYLTEDQLHVNVPSVFSMKAHTKTSSNYALIPTIDCIRGLEKAGFYPVKAKETNCRDENNAPFAKHLLRFRREGIVEVGGSVPEIVMINSHDGKNSYQLKAGIYRLVCANGLVVGSELFARTIRHQGDVVSKVVEAAGEIIDIIPKAVTIIEEWKGIQLNEDQRIAYAESAALLKWDKETRLLASKLLSPRRVQDTSKDLWSTFNVLQENIIKGGIRYRNSPTEENPYAHVRRNSTRAINSVSENTRLNCALWNLTEKMATLVK